MEKELKELGFSEFDFHFELKINDITIWINKTEKRINIENKRSILSTSLFDYDFNKTKTLIELLS